MKSRKESFVFYRDWYEGIKALDVHLRSELIEAIIHFAFEGVEPPLSKEAKTIFNFVRPKLVRDANKYEDMCRKNAENGQKGGRPKKTQITHSVTNNPLGYENHDKDNDKENDKDIKESTKVPKKNISLPISERMEKFRKELSPYLKKYGKDMLNDFYEYWSEPDRKGNKMKFELEKTWRLSSRLSRWQRRGNNGKSC